MNNKAICRKTDEHFTEGKEYECTAAYSRYESAVVDILDDGETTVGTNVSVSHIKASGVGSVITAYASLLDSDVDGRKLTFKVEAKEEDGSVIGAGEIERFVVLSDRFMKKVESK